MQLKNRRHNLSEQTKQFESLILKDTALDSYRKTHAKTFHIGQSLSIDSSESDREMHFNERRATQVLPRPKFKAVQQFSYITQKMMPDYERNLKTISVIESKAYQINFTNQGNERKETCLGEGEVPINYSVEKHPIELNPEFVNVQKIRQLEFYYYKIKCFGEQCPISFQMIQSDQTKFKMFLSSTNPFPSKFSCEQIYQVKVWKYKGNHHKLFKQNYIFISLVCDLDTTIKLSFNFGSNVCPVKSPIKMASIPGVINCNLTAEQILKKRRERTLSLAKGRNLVQENIMNVTLQNECFKKQQYRTIQQQKLQEVIQKKKEIDFSKQGQKEITYFQKQFTFFLKKMKQQQLIDTGQFRSETIYQWIRLLSFVNCIAQIKERLHHQQKLILHVQIIQIKMKTIYYRARRNICRLKGPRIHSRAHLDVKFCLWMFCKQIQQKSRGQNLKIILPHLEYRALLWGFREKMHQTSRHLQLIKDAIYTFVIRLRGYRNFLKHLFEKHFDEYFISFYLAQDEKLKKQLEIWYNYSKYTLYFQLMSRIFSNLLVQQNIKSFLKNARSQRFKKCSQHSNKSKKSEKQFCFEKVIFYKVPLQKDFLNLMIPLYNQTKAFTEQYGKDQIRKGFQKLKF